MKLSFAGLLTSAAIMGAASFAHADIVIDLNNHYHGDAPDSTYVAQITYSNAGAGKVKMTVESKLSTDYEYIQELAFNVVSAHHGKITVDTAAVVQNGTIGTIGFNTANISEFQADFVLNFEFPTNAADRFNLDDKFYIIFASTLDPLVDVLDETDFDSTVPFKQDDSILLRAAAKIAGFDGSGEVGDTPDDDTPRVPEPASLGVLGLGAVALLTRRRAK